MTGGEWFAAVYAAVGVAVGAWNVRYYFRPSMGSEEHWTDWLMALNPVLVLLWPLCLGGLGEGDVYESLCSHRDRVEVRESLTGDVVAALCLECDRQLPADMAPVTLQPGTVGTPLQRALQPPRSGMTLPPLRSMVVGPDVLEEAPRTAVPRF